MAVSDYWRTPPALFAALNEEFHFDLDVAADDQNHLTPQYFTETNSAFNHIWNGPWFMNHPYSNSGEWIRKAAAEGVHSVGVGLVPYMPSERWWTAIELTAVEVRRIPHRVKFYKADGTPGGTARFPSAVVVWRPQPRLMGWYPPRYVAWDYR